MQPATGVFEPDTSSVLSWLVLVTTPALQNQAPDAFLIPYPYCKNTSPHAFSFLSVCTSGASQDAESTINKA